MQHGAGASHFWVLIIHVGPYVSNASIESDFADYFGNLSKYTQGRVEMDRLYEEACLTRDLETLEEIQPKQDEGQTGDWIPGNIQHNIDQLYELAPRAKAILDQEVADVVRQAELPESALVTVRLKGATDDPDVFDHSRIKEKAKGKYLKKHPSSDGMALILDIVRMSIMCETVNCANFSSWK